MTKQTGVSRRNLLAGGAALGLGTMMGPMAGMRAFAQNALSIPYSNKSLDYYFFVIQEEAVKRAKLNKTVVEGLRGHGSILTHRLGCFDHAPATRRAGLLHSSGARKWVFHRYFRPLVRWER